MIRKSSDKPEKPYPDFPLTAHPNGQWCKKIRGRLHYFGPWIDWQAALQLFLDQKDDLYAGRTPRANGDFLSAKKRQEQSGEIEPRSYKDYEETCDLIEASLGGSRLTHVGTKGSPLQISQAVTTEY